MTTVTNQITSPIEDYEEPTRKSFFVAVCDCDEGAFLFGFGCIHPYHVIPASVVSRQDVAKQLDT